MRHVFLMAILSRTRSISLGGLFSLEHREAINRSLLVYQFPVVAITNFHRLACLKQQKLILSQFWMTKLTVSLTGPKSRCLQSLSPSRGLRGVTVPCVLRGLRGVTVPCILRGLRGVTVPCIPWLLVVANILWLAASSHLSLPSLVHVSQKDICDFIQGPFE